MARSAESGLVQTFPNIVIQPSWLTCAANRDLFALCGASRMRVIWRQSRVAPKDLSGPP